MWSHGDYRAHAQDSPHFCHRSRLPHFNLLHLVPKCSESQESLMQLLRVSTHRRARLFKERTNCREGSAKCLVCNLCLIRGGTSRAQPQFSPLAFGQYIREVGENQASFSRTRVSNQQGSASKGHIVECRTRLMGSGAKVPPSNGRSYCFLCMLKLIQMYYQRESLADVSIAVRQPSTGPTKDSQTETTGRPGPFRSKKGILLTDREEKKISRKRGSYF